MNTKLVLPLLSLLPVAMVTATGCGDSEPAPRGPFVARSAELHQAESCDDLLAQLKRDASVKMNDAINRNLYWLNERTSDVADGEGSSSASTGSGSSAGAQDDGAPEHSETNNQVEGVHEADIVKTDGFHLYVLHEGELAIVNAWPLDTFGLGSTTPIEGSPIEMFVHEGNAVVFSRVSSDDGLLSCAEGDWRCYRDFTKVTVIGIDGTQTEVKGEQYLQGYYSSSRRIGNQVRLVTTDWSSNRLDLEYYPNEVDYDRYDDVDYMTARYETLRRQNQAVIDAATLEDFLPHQFVRDGGQLSEVPRSCGDYYVPTAGTSEYGRTSIASFDLTQPTAPAQATHITGQSWTVYASQDNLYVAGASWNDHRWIWAYQSETPLSVTSTLVHKFSTDTAKPTYVGSARVPGRLNDQFSLDERDGVLRLVTTDRLVSKDEWTSENDLFLLGEDMLPIGEVTGLAPGEAVYSTRFVGDRGYVVTFRQIDPLFVFDLKDPRQPKLMAELKIPGFSTYMHPIAGGDYLLTIGRDGDDDGTVGEPALQLFDVRDATNPVLKHKHVLSGGWSEAAYNHKAFTFFGSKLAIPTAEWTSQGMESNLQLFDIDVEQGISPHGSVSHSGFFDEVVVDDGTYYDEWCMSYQGRVRRGVFIDDSIYSISRGGIVVNNTATMTEEARLPLPFEAENFCYYY